MTWIKHACYMEMPVSYVDVERLWMVHAPSAFSVSSWKATQAFSNTPQHKASHAFDNNAAISFLLFYKDLADGIHTPLRLVFRYISNFLTYELMVHPPLFIIQLHHCTRTSTKDINMSLLTGLLITWLMTTKQGLQDWTIIWWSLERSTSREKTMVGQHELTFLFLQPRGFCLNLD